MASVLDLVKHYQHNIEKYPQDEQKVLKYIDKLFHLDVKVQHLQDTGVGRTVNALRKEPGDVGQAARALVYKWKLMVAAEESDQEGDHNNEISTITYNSNGKDSDDNANQARRRDINEKSNTTPRPNQKEHKQNNGDYSGSKRRYQSSEEEEPETKKSKQSSSSENDDYKRKQVKSEPSESDSQESDSQSDDSDSDASESSDEERKGHHKIKTEPLDKHKPPSKHSSHSNHGQHKRESSSSKNNPDVSEKHAKQESSETKHSSHKSSSKERSHSSREKKSKEKESSSEKKHKDHKSSEKDKRHREESRSSSKHSSSERHRSSSQKAENVTEKQKNQSEKNDNKPEKHSSSNSHKSHKEKSKSSSEKEISNDKHKSRDSSSSKEKHSSSSKEKSKEKRSSSKEKSSSHKSDKKHSSSNDSKSRDSKNSSEKSEDKSSEKKSSHKSKSSSSHKSSRSSSSKSKEEIPKKKPEITNGADSDDGIDCGSGASFAEALGMLPPSKSKKKLTPVKDAYSPNNSAGNDLSPAALLAPSAKLAPLPALEISALPEISPNYKPRPPPKFLPHFSDDDAMAANISSKNQRTKVYSGNKVLGKISSLYEMCVEVLQEHIDALEFTGGVPYEILKPVVDRATPQQLFMLEHYNAYLMEDTDHLWQKHCEKHFRNKKRQEMETWREMYMRCQEEQEYKLKSLTENIRITQEAKKAPIKQTKMAYVDSIVKPPRNVARKQALHGTAHASTASPAARVASLASGPNVLKGGAVRPPPAASVSASSFNKPKKAPLMQKALQFMRGRKR